jgi:hypothetical protein
MNDESRGLVDDGQMLVFVRQDERNGAGLKGSGRFVLRKLHQHSLASREHSRSAGDLAVDADPLVGYEAGSLGSGEAELIGQKSVKSLSLVG